MPIDRRSVWGAGLGAGVSLAAGTAEARPHAFENAASGASQLVAAEGELDAAQFGILAGGNGDQSGPLQRAIDTAASSRSRLRLPPGRYLASGLVLRAGTMISGTPGASIIAYAGGGEFVRAGDAADIRLYGLTFDGNAKPLALSRTSALLAFTRCHNLDLTELQISNGLLNGLTLSECSGLVSRCKIEHCGNAGVFSTDAAPADGGLELSHNSVSDCGNNGMLVWRSKAGEDGTRVSHNRIARIAARAGGTGQNGNGINIFRAHGVQVSNNRIDACAFSAVRGNGASNLQVMGNACNRLGEVALYAEFGFEGVIIAHNLVDGAAHGISVTNFNEGGRLAVVQGNLIRNIQLRVGDAEPRGYGISVEADAAVTGNVIEGAPTVGLTIGWGRWMRDVVASGNMIRGCRIGIGVSGSAGAGRALLSGNMICGSREGAIRAMEQARPFGPDLAQPGAAQLAHITLAGNAAA